MPVPLSASSMTGVSGLNVALCVPRIVRRCALDVDDLYRVHGRYPKWNPVALVALVLGVLPNVPGFLHASGWLLAARPGESAAESAAQSGPAVVGAHNASMHTVIAAPNRTAFPLGWPDSDVRPDARADKNRSLCPKDHATVNR